MTGQILDQLATLVEDYDTIEEICEDMVDYISSMNLDPEEESHFTNIFSDMVETTDDSSDVESYASKVTQKIRAHRSRKQNIDREARRYVDYG
jgi:hypothetical protein